MEIKRTGAENTDARSVNAPAWEVVKGMLGRVRGRKRAENRERKRAKSGKGPGKKRSGGKKKREKGRKREKDGYTYRKRGKEIEGAKTSLGVVCLSVYH